MSNRSDIIEGRDASSARKGLVYTCKCGWIDLGHARPDAAKELWRKIRGEIGERSPNGQWFSVSFEEHMRWKPFGVSENFAVQLGLTLQQQESVALAILLRVSVAFEKYQGSGWRQIHPGSRDSSFSAEDLVSNLVGFYRAVRPKDYISLCKPVSKAASEAVWDSYGAVGSHKNTTASPYLFPCKECGPAAGGPMCAPMPRFLSGIVPADEGTLFRLWNSADPELVQKQGVPQMGL